MAGNDAIEMVNVRGDAATKVGLPPFFVAPSPAPNLANSSIVRRRYDAARFDRNYLEEEMIEHDRRVAQAFLRLETNETAQPIIHAWSSIIENSQKAFDVVQKSLEMVEDIELLPQVARFNLNRQAGLLLIAASEVLDTGQATVSVFGEYKTLRTFEEIESLLSEIKTDFQAIAELPPTFQDFCNSGLNKIAKYLFDSRNIEMEKDRPAKMLILEHHKQKGLARQLQEAGIITEKDLLDFREVDRDFKNSSVVADNFDRNPSSIFSDYDPLPDIVYLNAPTPEILNWEYDLFERFVQDWSEIPPDRRPIVIVNTDGYDMALEYKFLFTGFLIAERLDDLINMTHLAKDLMAAREKPPFMGETIALLQEKLYDKLDLRDIEAKTANTYQSLRTMFENMQRWWDEAIERGKQRYSPKSFAEWLDGGISKSSPRVLHNTMMAKRKTVHLEEDARIKTVLDLGTGQGRMAIPLAMTGINVIGIDISSVQLEEGKRRLLEECTGLRGDKPNSNLSYNALLRLQQEGLIPTYLDPVSSDPENVRRHYLTAKGNFLHIFDTLNEIINTWDESFPEIDRERFFHVVKGSFWNPEDNFLDAGFDAVTLNWHTFCEVGG